ncbi:MAG: thiopeptide-type bacteriocin biosynthesis protein [Bacteroidota bacterium]
MTDIRNNQWLSAYLYYNEPWETFLVEAVAPYIKTAMQTGIAEQYFFIRYWDRGPHIRLRFKGAAGAVNRILRPNLEEHFLSYFDSKPSQRTDPNYPPSFPEHFKWIPNNSVVFVPYEAEIRRYGGPEAIHLAELQFQASSDVALHSLERRFRNWSYDDALGLAIKLHLIFVDAMRMDLSEAMAFFHFLYHNWLPRSFRYYHKKLSRADYLRQAQEVTEAFAQSFDLQKANLIPFHQALWEALKTGDEFEEATLNQWRQSNQSIREQLGKLAEQGQLVDRPSEEEYALLNNSVLDQLKLLCWSIYGDYFHMTNNRLGILNRDEGFVAYLMMESLKALNRTTNGERQAVLYRED